MAGFLIACKVKSFVNLFKCGRNFCVTRQPVKKDGRGILKGEYSLTLPFWASLRQRNLIASIYIYLYMEAGSPVSTSLPAFFVAKKAGTRAA